MSAEGFDASRWEAAQSKQQYELRDKLRRIVGEAALSSGSAPVVQFTCPKGHGLRRWRLDEDGNGDLFLSPLPGEARRSGTITEDAFPRSRPRPRTVCDEPGCGTTIENGPGFCDVHGGRRAEFITTRTRFTCRRHGCNWTDELTLSRLIKLYGVAVSLGHDQISLAGQATRR